MGRFISEDPIGLMGGINMYACVGGNPLNYIDPLGLKPCPGTWTGIVTFASGIGSTALGVGLLDIAFHAESSIIFAPEALKAAGLGIGFLSGGFYGLYRGYKYMLCEDRSTDCRNRDMPRRINLQQLFLTIESS